MITDHYRHWETQAKREGIWKVGSGGCSLEELLQKQTMSDERTTVSTRAWWAGTGRRSRQRTLKNRMREEQNQKHVTAGCSLKPITPSPQYSSLSFQLHMGLPRERLHSLLCSSVWPLCLSQPDVSRCVPIPHPYTHA